jgi:hypothetical protein
MSPGEASVRGYLLDVGAENVAVHSAIHDQRGGEACGTQAGDKGGCFPVSVRNWGDQPLTTRRASVSTRHVGGGPGLVNEDQPVWIQARLAISPGPACGRYIRPLLLGGM